jgi:hypothetical protein
LYGGQTNNNGLTDSMAQDCCCVQSTAVAMQQQQSFLNGNVSDSLWFCGAMCFHPSQIEVSLLMVVLKALKALVCLPS